MKRKNIISLSVALSFLTLSVTGLLLYMVQHNKTTTVIHVVFGLLFIAFAVFHIVNNWSSLAAYTTGANKRTWIKKEFLWSFAFVGAFLVGSYFQLPPFAQIDEFGSTLRKGNSKPRPTKITFEEIETNKEVIGRSLRLSIQKGKDATLPAIVIWVEDSARTFVDNVFIPAKVASLPTGTEDVRRAINSGKLDFNDLNAEDFKLWKSKAAVQTPTYTKETPTDNFFLATKTKAAKTFFIVMEIKDQAKIEHYEALIEPSKSDVFKFKSVGEGTLAKAFVEVQ